MSTLAKRMMGLGETSGVTTAGDIPPVMTGMSSALVAPRPVGDKKPKKSVRSKVVSGIIGRIKEDEDEGVIPDDAKEVDSLVTSVSVVATETPNLPDQDKPTTVHKPGEKEPLISPAAALVAPDVTPDALKPLDPSQVPGADLGHAPVPRQEPPPSVTPTSTPPSSAVNPLEVILGKTAPASTPAAPASGPTLQAGGVMPVESVLPGIVSPAAVAATTAATPINEAALMASQGAGMPEHQTGNSAAVMSAFRRFSR